MTKKIVKFNGGLGNQMFQYAFGCSLADRFNAEILFDFSYFENVKSHDNVTTREFELGVFGVECKSVTAEDLINVKYPNFNSKLKNTIAKRFPEFFGVNYIREKKNTLYDKRLLSKKNFLLYEGYFQNEKYFKAIKQTLLNKFVLKEDLDEKNKQMLDEINKTNSISIHIRRGDYVSLDYVNKIHGVCSLDYYKKAIKHISKKVDMPHFFLFSDDIDWVIENLKIEHPYTVVDLNQNKGWLDMELMKHCKHNIIANSSFSWWGAWLNQNKDKIVIAPKNWMTKKQRCDIIPSDWRKI